MSNDGKESVIIQEWTLEVEHNERIDGALAIPKNAAGLVLFAHGSGSSRFSPRNIFVAEQLYEAGFATLLMDLLTKREEAIDLGSREYRFDIDLLAERLILATNKLMQSPQTSSLPIGYFGSSTGAAAALVAASRLPERITAVVSRGGRSDLADEVIGEVKGAILFIAGGNDVIIIHVNRKSLERVTTKAMLRIVEGAGHLFEEPGALEEVSRISQEWFKENLSNG